MQISRETPETYRIVRFYYDANKEKKILKEGVTLQEAQAHCQDPETNSRTATNKEAFIHTEEYGNWFDAYEPE